MLDRTEAAQILQIVDVDMPVVDLVAALAQEIADHVLTRPFGAAGRGDRDKIPRGRKLRIEAGVDGVEDFLLVIAGVHRVLVPWSDFGSRDRSKHTLPGTPARYIAFRIAIRALQSAVNPDASWRIRMPGNRNVLYLIIGALIVAVGVLGYNHYQTKKQPEGLQINVGPDGLKIQSK